MLFIFVGGTGGRYLYVGYPGCAALVCLLAAVVCGSPVTVCSVVICTNNK